MSAPSANLLPPDSLVGKHSRRKVPGMPGEAKIIFGASNRYSHYPNTHPSRLSESCALPEFFFLLRSMRA